MKTLFFKSTRQTRTFLVLVLCSFLSFSSFCQAELFEGSFVNKESGMTLQLSNQKGMLSSNGLQLPIQITQVENNVAGGIITDTQSGEMAAFAMMVENGQFMMYVDGLIIAIEKVSATAAAQTTSTVVQTQTQTRPPSSAPSTGISAQWKQAIGGKKLIYMKTTSYSSRKKRLLLYANSQFAFDENGGYSSSDATSDFSYHDQNALTGSWDIQDNGQQAFLILTYQTGEVEKLVLTPRSSEAINMNGSRWFVTAMNSSY